MTNSEFRDLVKSLEYLAVDEVIRDIRSTKKYNEKLGKTYITDDDFAYLADRAKWHKKGLKMDFLKSLSHKDILEIANENKNNYGELYTLIRCFYSNDYRSRVLLCSFTNEDVERYQKLANDYKQKLITE